MKYIIEIPDEVEWGVVTCRTEDGFFTRDFDSLEELNSDYINEHYGDLQDTVYQKGYKDCETRYCSFDACPNRQAEYQRGLDDAWEAARKIVTWPNRSLVNSDTFDLDPGENIFTKYSASRAIEKLKAYEEKQNDKIEVGDEVNWNSDVIVVTRLYKDDGVDWCDGISKDGIAFHVLTENVRKKTGRHFDIASILEDMRND